MSASPPRVDICIAQANVCFVPQADVALTFGSKYFGIAEVILCDMSIMALLGRIPAFPEDHMNRHCIVSILATAVLGLALMSGSALSQQKSLKEQLVGTWALVSINRSSTFGADPKGVAFFDDSGHYIIAVMRTDRPKYAVNDRAQGTAEENKATAQGTLTYFGTYSVNEADRTIAIHVVSSSFPNWNGADQKRIFTLTGDELKLANRIASA